METDGLGMSPPTIISACGETIPSACLRDIRQPIRSAPTRGRRRAGVPRSLGLCTAQVSRGGQILPARAVAAGAYRVR